MDGRSIFWELHDGLPRQAPGSEATTRHLLGRCGPMPASPTVLDVGCGPGRSTLVLADALPTSLLTAVDLHRGYGERRDLAVATQSV